MSPNTKDTIKKRKSFRNYDEMVKIYRILTWEDLWSLFKADPANKVAVSHLQAKKEHFLCPPQFITAAPWYLVKGKSESCLCLRCEQMGCKQRPRLAVARILKELLENLRESNAPGSEELMVMITAAHAVLSPTYKSDMCKAALQPCLGDNPMSCASEDCQDGGCDKCDFDIVWAKLRSKIMTRVEDQEGNIS